MKTTFMAAATAAFSSAIFSASVLSQEATIVTGSKGVTFVNILTPSDGITLETLAAELTEAMKQEVRFQLGFKNASVHIARDGAYVLNYAQWENTESVDAVVKLLQAGKLPELAQAFSMASPEFHPYDVASVTIAAE